MESNQTLAFQQVADRCTDCFKGNHFSSIADVIHQMTSNRLKVLIVDDHALVLHGFALSVLELFPDAEVLEANSLEGALATVRRNPDLSLVLFDLHLDSDDGLTGVRRMIEALEGVPLIVISASDESADVIDSVRAGAKGYILKSGSSAFSNTRSRSSCREKPTSRFPGPCWSAPSRPSRSGRPTICWTG